MSINKVIYDGNTLIDLTDDTVEPSNLLLGYTAHSRSGASIVGTFDPSIYVLKAGDTMTGALTLSGAPTSNLHAATKKYVDDAVGAITDTKVTQTVTTADAGYNVLFSNSTRSNTSTLTEGARKASTLYYNPCSGLRVDRYNDTANVRGTYLVCGNEIPNGTIGSTKGILRLFDNTEYYGQIQSNTNAPLTDNRTYYLPDETGTLVTRAYLASIGSATTPVYFNGYGKPTACTSIPTSFISGNFVTSIAMSGNNGVTISGSPITSSGTITVGLNLSNAINELTIGNVGSDREDYIITQYAEGGSTNVSYHRRALKNVFKALNSSDITTALGYTPVNKAGDTMSGSLNITNSNVNITEGSVARSYNITTSGGLTFALHLSTSGNQGLYSTGYASSPTATPTASAQWVIYRGDDGQVYIPLWKNVGSSSTPVYIDSSGKVAACTSIDSSLISGGSLTDENVKQTNSTNNNSYRLLFSVSANDTTTTEGTRKSGSLLFNPSSASLYLMKSHTATATTPSSFTIGNSVADGTAGATYGRIIFYGKSSYYAMIYDKNTTLTANREYYLPDETGTLVTRAYLVSVGNATTPVYFNSAGKPTVCTSIPASFISGNFVTSVALSGSTGISISGSPITSSGTITVGISTSSGTATRNTTNTSAGEIKYIKYGRVVTIYTSSTFTISSSGASANKVLFSGLPKPSANVCFIGYGPSNKAVTFGVNTDGQLVSMFQAPPTGMCQVGATYIAAS